MTDWHVSLAAAREALFEAEHPFAVLMTAGTMSVELYSPVGTDEQTPHAQDELYVIVKGTGMFNRAGERRPFQPNDVIFVPAGMDHRFEGFSDDFQTFVIFWGPKGGEAAAG